MFTKLISGEITFFYTHASLFDDVQHLSAFMCKNIVDKEGGDLSERFAITDDEKGMFDICLREALPSIYGTVKVLTHALSQAFDDGGSLPVLAVRAVAAGTTVPSDTYRLPVEGDTAEQILAIAPSGEAVYVVGCAGETAGSDVTYYSSEDTDVVIIHTVDHGAYNPNDIKLVDSALRSAIEQGVLAEYYTRVTEKTLTEMSAQQAAASLVSLSGRIIPLRKKTVL